MSREDEILLGIACLEVLPRKIAAYCYDELGKRLQSEVKQFLDSGTYPEGKIATQILASEQILTILGFQQVISDRFELDSTNLVAIRGLEVSDKIEILKTIDSVIVHRFIQYLAESEIASILQSLRAGSDDDLANGLLRELGSNYEPDEKHDQIIYEEIQAFRSRQTSTSDQDKIDYFVSLSLHLNKTDRLGLIEIAKEKFGLSEASLATTFLSVESLAYLENACLKRLVEELSLDQIFAVESYDPDLYQRVAEFLSPIRRESVEDRRDLVIALDEAKQERWANERLEEIKVKLFEMKSKGQLEFVSESINSSANSAREAS